MKDLIDQNYLLYQILHTITDYGLLEDIQGHLKIGIKVVQRCLGYLGGLYVSGVKKRSILFRS